MLPLILSCWFAGQQVAFSSQICAFVRQRKGDEEHVRASLATWAAASQGDTYDSNLTIKVIALDGLENVADASKPTSLVTPVLSATASHFFDGSDDCREKAVGHDAKLPMANSPYTIEALVKPAIDIGNGGIVGWGDWGHANKVNSLRFGGPRRLTNVWWGNDFTVDLPRSLADGDYHHIAATWDGRIRRIFVDFFQVGSALSTGYAATNQSTFCIGQTNQNEFFKGEIKDVKIWRIAKTLYEIEADAFKVPVVTNPSHSLLQMWVPMAAAAKSCEWLLSVDSHTYVNIPALTERLRIYNSSHLWMLASPRNKSAGHDKRMYVFSKHVLEGTVVETVRSCIASGLTFLDHFIQCLHMRRLDESEPLMVYDLGLVWQEFITDWSHVANRFKRNHQRVGTARPCRRLRMHRCWIAIQPVFDVNDFLWIHDRIHRYKRHVIPNIDEVLKHEGVPLLSLGRYRSMSHMEQCVLDPIELLTNRGHLHQKTRDRTTEMWLTAWRQSQQELIDPELRLQCAWTFFPGQCEGLEKIPTRQSSFESCASICCQSMFCTYFSYHDELGCWMNAAGICDVPRLPGWRSGVTFSKRFPVQQLWPPDDWVPNISELKTIIEANISKMIPEAPTSIDSWSPETWGLQARQEQTAFSDAYLSLAKLPLQDLEDTQEDNNNIYELVSAAISHGTRSTGMAWIVARIGTPSEATINALAPLAHMKNTFKLSRATTSAIERRLFEASHEFTLAHLAGGLFGWIILCTSMVKIHGGQCLRTGLAQIMVELKDYRTQRAQQLFLTHVRRTPFLKWMLGWTSQFVNPKFFIGEIDSGLDKLQDPESLYGDQIAALVNKLEKHWRVFAGECLKHYENMNAAPWPTLFVEHDDWRLTVLYSTSDGWIPELCKKFPRTCELLQQVFPLRRDWEQEVSHLAKTSFASEEEVGFFALTPGSRVRTHNGGSNMRLNIHVGLAGLEGARLLLRNSEMEWQLGKAIVFNDGVDHGIVHDGDHIRFVLFARLRHPSVTFFDYATLISNGEIIDESFKLRSFY